MSNDHDTGAVAMTLLRMHRFVFALALTLAAVTLTSASKAQETAVSGSTRETTTYKVAPASLVENAARPQVHPLAPLIDIAQEHYDYIREHVRDYTCVLVKRERIDGDLLPTEHMLVKFRGRQVPASDDDAPFSVYLKLLAPRSLRGREILYVSGRNSGDVMVRKGGRRASFLTLHIDPLGGMAMRDNRYPITAFGIENLLRRLIDVAELDSQYGECDVRVVPGAKVDGRLCTMYQVTHPVRRSYFRFHIARVFQDHELRVPIRYVAYLWPTEKGDSPPLLEEYTYRNLKLNVGLTHADFDATNPAYGFRQRD